MQSQQVPKILQGNKISNPYPAPTISGAHQRAKWLHVPCSMGDPQCTSQETTTQNTSTLPSWMPKGGACGYITPIAQGAPKAQRGGETSVHCENHDVLGVHMWAMRSNHPYSMLAQKRVARRRNHNWLQNLCCPFRGPHAGTSRQKHHPCHLKGSQPLRRNRMLNLWCVRNCIR